MTGADDADRDTSEIDERLRQLFAGPELGAVRAPDPDAVVAGARRRSRRRAAISAGAGVFVMLGAVTAGLAVSGFGDAQGPGDVTAGGADSVLRSTDVPASGAENGSDHERPPPGDTTVQSASATPPVSVPPSVAPPPSTPPSTVGSPVTGMAADGPAGRSRLGVAGTESLRLSMTYDEAVATGAMDGGDGPPAENGCRAYEVAGPGISRVEVRGGHGIVGFQAATALTPEGIGVDSPVTELDRAYPDTERRGDGHRVWRNSGEDSQYVFGVDAGRVATFRLTVADADITC